MSTQQSPYDSEYVPFLGVESWVSARLDEPIWKRYEQRLQAARLGMPAPAQVGELTKSLLAASVNTGAIEGLHNSDRGLTLTVVEHAVDWDKQVRAAEGKDAEAHVKAALESFEMALDAATKRQEISEMWIRQLHQVACAAQPTVRVETPIGQQEQPFPKGEYKSFPNHVEQADGSVHAYCPVGEVPIQMQRLIDELRTPAFSEAHPVIQTAFAHHALTNVHPFQDGNGRVARALASVFLLRATSVPLVIYPDLSVAYFAALEVADAGENQAFVDFVFDRSVDMLAFAADQALATGPLRAILPKDRTPAITIEAAGRLSSLVDREIRKRVDGVETSDEIDVHVSTMGFSQSAKDATGVRRTIARSHPMVEVVVKEYGLRPNRWFPVFAGVEEGLRFPVSLSNGSTDDFVEFRLEELHPEVTTAATLKMSAFVQRVLAELFDELNTELERR